jgi:hypothetical protein
MDFFYGKCKCLYPKYPNITYPRMHCLECNELITSTCPNCNLGRVNFACPRGAPANIYCDCGYCARKVLCEQCINNQSDYYFGDMINLINNISYSNTYTYYRGNYFKIPFSDHKFICSRCQKQSQDEFGQMLKAQGKLGRINKHYCYKCIIDIIIDRAIKHIWDLWELNGKIDNYFQLLPHEIIMTELGLFDNFDIFEDEYP